jgi:hypothetical protein
MTSSPNDEPQLCQMINILSSRVFPFLSLFRSLPPLIRSLQLSNNMNTCT